MVTKSVLRFAQDKRFSDPYSKPYENQAVGFLPFRTQKNKGPSYVNSRAIKAINLQKNNNTLVDFQISKGKYDLEKNEEDECGKEVFSNEETNTVKEYISKDGNFELTYQSSYLYENKSDPTNNSEYLSFSDANKNLIFVVEVNTDDSYCFLGLCNGNVLKQHNFNNQIWDELDLKKCIGGCDAVKTAYMIKHKGKIHYVYFWKGGNIEDISIMNKIILK